MRPIRPPPVRRLLLANFRVDRRRAPRRAAAVGRRAAPKNSPPDRRQGDALDDAPRALRALAWIAGATPPIEGPDQQTQRRESAGEGPLERPR